MFSPNPPKLEAEVVAGPSAPRERGRVEVVDIAERLIRGFARYVSMIMRKTMELSKY